MRRYGWLFCVGDSAVRVGIAPGATNVHLNATPVAAPALEAAAAALPVVRGTSASDLAYSDARLASRSSLHSRPDSSVVSARLAPRVPADFPIPVSAPAPAPAAAASASSASSVHEDAASALPLPMAALSSSHADEEAPPVRHTKLAAAGGAGAPPAVVVDESYPTEDRIKAFLSHEATEAGRPLTKLEVQFLSGFSNNQIEARTAIRAALKAYEKSKPGSTVSFKLVVRSGLIVRRELKGSAESVNEYLPLHDYEALLTKAADYINQVVKDKRQTFYLRVFQTPMSELSGSELGGCVNVNFCDFNGKNKIAFVLCRRDGEIIVIGDSVYDDVCGGVTPLSDCVDAVSTPTPAPAPVIASATAASIPVPAVASAVAAAAAAPAPSASLGTTKTAELFSRLGSSSAQKPPLLGRGLEFLSTGSGGYPRGSSSTGGGAAAAASRYRTPSSVGSPLAPRP